MLLPKITAIMWESVGDQCHNGLRATRDVKFQEMISERKTGGVATIYSDLTTACRWVGSTTEYIDFIANAAAPFDIVLASCLVPDNNLQ